MSYPWSYNIFGLFLMITFLFNSKEMCYNSLKCFRMLSNNYKMYVRNKCIYYMHLI